MDYKTKLRAFQLETEGALFSYYKPDHYTLIEARLPKGGIAVLETDLALHGKSVINLLHITSWDVDHCNYNDLTAIINKFRPSLIHVPDYLPDTEEGELCRKVILKYDDIHKRYVNNVQIISGTFIQGLSNAEPMDTNDVVYPSCYRSPIKNDMSLIRLFRSPGFNVLSLGDCESLEISKRLQQRNLIKTEVDVLILPHHGADNGFMTGDFLDTVNPRVAVCSSNYDNRFEHPDPRIRSLLAAREIPVMTTKRGDVIIYQTATYENAQAINFISGNKDLEKPISFKPKRFSRNQKAA